MELTLRTPEQIFARGVSPSSIKTWLTCKRRWYNDYVRGLRGEGSDAADFGNAFDAFLSKLYSPGVVYGVEQAIEEFKVAWPSDKDTDKRTQDLGIRLVREYYKRYPLETEPFKTLWTHHGDTNQGFTVPLEGVDVPLHVVLDSYVEQHGGLYALDHKTTSMLGATFFEQYRNDFQVYCYIYALGKHLGRNVEGLIVNAVGCKKVVNNESFARDVIIKTEAQVAYGMKQFVKIASEMIAHVRKNYQDPEEFPMSSHSIACKSFNTKCPYLEMCEFADNQMFAHEILRRKQERNQQKLEVGGEIHPKEAA